MISLKELGYVSVGMIISDVNGNVQEIIGITVPSTKQSVKTAFLPEGCDLVLELSNSYFNYPYHLWTDIGWEFLDKRIAVLNHEHFKLPVVS